MDCDESNEREVTSSFRRFAPSRIPVRKSRRPNTVQASSERCSPPPASPVICSPPQASPVRCSPPQASPVRRTPRIVGMIKKAPPRGYIPPSGTPALVNRIIRKEMCTPETGAISFGKGTPWTRLRTPGTPCPITDTPARKTPGRFKPQFNLTRGVGRMVKNAGMAYTPRFAVPSPISSAGSEVCTPVKSPVSSPLCTPLKSPVRSSACTPQTSPWKTPPHLPPRVTPPGTPWNEFAQSPASCSSPVKRRPAQTPPRPNSPWKWPEGSPRYPFRGAVVGRYPQAGERVTGFGSPFGTYDPENPWGPESYITSDFDECDHLTSHPGMKYVGSIPPTEPDDDEFDEYVKTCGEDIEFRTQMARERGLIDRDRYKAEDFPTWMPGNTPSSRCKLVYPDEEGYEPPEPPC